jgi:flagellar hook-basal body complex protein FliE
MMNPIAGANAAIPLPANPMRAAGGEPPSPQFMKLLMNSLNDVNSMQLQADQAVEQLFTGGDVNPAEVLSAVQKADMSFKLLMQVRNKLVQAFQEIKEIRI